jgi:hypothetical protein
MGLVAASSVGEVEACLTLSAYRPGCYCPTVGTNTGTVNAGFVFDCFTDKSVKELVVIASTDSNDATTPAT